MISFFLNVHLFQHRSLWVSSWRPNENHDVIIRGRIPFPSRFSIPFLRFCSFLFKNRRAFFCEWLWYDWLKIFLLKMPLFLSQCDKLFYFSFYIIRTSNRQLEFNELIFFFSSFSTKTDFYRIDLTNEITFSWLIFLVKNKDETLEQITLFSWLKH